MVFLNDGLKTAQDLNSPWVLPLIHLTLGNYWLALDDKDLAVDHYGKAIEIIEGVRGRLEVSDHIRSFSSGFAKTYEKMVSVLIDQGRHEEAYEYVQRNRARAFMNLIAQGAEKELLPETEDVLRVSEVQNTITDTTTLVEYYITEDRLFIWTIKANEYSLTQLDVSREEIQEQVRGFKDALLEQGAVEVRARKLYDNLIQPIEHQLTTEQIIVVPHGVLHYLPSQALKDGHNQYLVDRFTISYLPAVSLLKYHKGEKEYPERSLLALGNPKLDRPEYEDLPHAEEEVRAVARLFDKNQIPQQEEATEDKFRELAPDFSFLHLACHSELDAASPMYSGLLLAPGSQHDGELDVHEIFTLNLNAELVVLSACQTAMGFLTNGDDLVGLSRAFISAGADAVISSLWSVSDESTAYLMERFYFHLKRNSKVRALQLAQKETIEKYGKPYAWAPFILIGDPS
jgi:CHAT domain-containing protein